MASTPRLLARAGLLVAGLTLGGCPSLLDGFDLGVAPGPDMALVHGFVAGEWQIIGSGRFERCGGPFSEAAFDLRSSVFTVEQDARGYLDALGVAGPDGRVFPFEGGRIIGDAVSFVTLEETERGPIRLEYTGELDTLSNVRGRFEGIGPDACLSAGIFTVRVELAEPPPPPDVDQMDSGPTDSGPIDVGPADDGPPADAMAVDAAATDGAAADGQPDGPPVDGG